MNVRVFEKRRRFLLLNLHFFISIYSLFFSVVHVLVLCYSVFASSCPNSFAYSAPGERLGSDFTVSWTCSVACQTMLWLFIVGQWRAGSVFLVNLHLPMPVNSTFTFNKSNL